eukprot:6194045-Pleurochrysis_carterae.AAC.1
MEIGGDARGAAREGTAVVQRLGDCNGAEATHLARHTAALRVCWWEKEVVADGEKDSGQWVEKGGPRGPRRERCSFGSRESKLEVCVCGMEGGAVKPCEEVSEPSTREMQISHAQMPIFRLQDEQRSFNSLGILAARPISWMQAYHAAPSAVAAYRMSGNSLARSGGL